MSEDLILKCLIAFVLGVLIFRMIRGNGLSVGGQQNIECKCQNGDTVGKNECRDFKNDIRRRNRDFAGSIQVCKKCDDGYFKYVYPKSRHQS